MAVLLIVDDDADLRRMLARLLAHEGHEILLAANGSAALALVESRPSLIIADLMMPEMDGETMLQTWRKRYDEAPAILLLTASAIREEVAERLGVASLAKPFDADELRSTVEELLAARS